MTPDEELTRFHARRHAAALTQAAHGIANVARCVLVAGLEGRSLTPREEFVAGDELERVWRGISPEWCRKSVAGLESVLSEPNVRVREQTLRAALESVTEMATAVL